MMVFLYVVLAILGISSIITFLIVFLINKTSNKDDYDEVEFSKTKEFNPDKFDDDEENESFDEDAEIISGNLELIDDNNDKAVLEEVKSEAELDKVDFLENTQTKLKTLNRDIKNKFDADNSNKEELKDLEKTSQNLKLNLGMHTEDEEDDDRVILPDVSEVDDEEII